MVEKLEQVIKLEKEHNDQIRSSNNDDQLNLNNKCSILEEYQTKAEKQLEVLQKDIVTLQEEVEMFKTKVDTCEMDLKDKDQIIKEKEDMLKTVKEELLEVKAAKEKLQAEFEPKIAEVYELRQKLDRVTDEHVLKALRSEEWVKAVGQRETCKLFCRS